MTALENLIGLIVRKVEKLHDYFQIVFSDGTNLSIFNKYDYDGGSVLDIEGKTVKSVNESESSAIIFFESGESLSIGFDDDDYNGPEAMALRREGESPLVWN
jgi:hypothetical protein